MEGPPEISERGPTGAAVMNGLSLQGSLPVNLLGLATSESPSVIHPEEGLVAGKRSRHMEHPKGFRSYQQGDWVGPVAQVVLVGLVDSLACLQVALEVQEGSGEANPVGPEVGHLVDPKVGCLVGL